jgi:integrase
MLQKGGKFFPPAEMDLSGDKPKKTDTAIPTMTLAEAVEGCQKDRDALKTKDEATCDREDSGLALWVEKFGKMLLADMTDGTLIDFGTWRRDVVRQANKQRATQTKGEGATRKPAHVSGRTLDLNQYFHDYMRLMQHTGARENETTLQAWPNVTWSRIAEFDGDGGHLCRKGDRVPGKIFFPGKNAKAGGGKPAEDRWIPLHQDLEDHLKAMYERKDPSSDWMFPARRGRPGHTLRFHKQLERVKRELREKYCSDPKDAEKSFWFDRVTFQWFRHYFISHAVMAGIDYKTIADWVSHRDGGVLIGRLYGHLDTMHSEQMSDKLSAHLAARRYPCLLRSLSLTLTLCI